MEPAQVRIKTAERETALLVNLLTSYVVLHQKIKCKKKHCGARLFLGCSLPGVLSLCVIVLSVNRKQFAAPSQESETWHMALL